MDVERIIQSIKQGDQDGVLTQLQQFNRQYAENFFFDVEKWERKKFRKNKVREYVSDSESDFDDESGDPDIIFRQNLAIVLIRFLRSEPKGQLLMACLCTLRILSRDKKVLGPLITDTALLTLARIGGISHMPLPEDDLGDHLDPYDDIIKAIANTKLSLPDDDENDGKDEGDDNCTDYETAVKSSVHKALTRGKRDSRGSTGGDQEKEEEGKEDDEEVQRKEAMKVLCNIIYNSTWAQERASELSLLCGLTEKLAKETQSGLPSCGQFYELRFMFLITALRPELRIQLKQEGGVSLLTSVLEQCLSVQWKQPYEVVLDPSAPPVSVENSQRAQEILKILFNVTYSTHTQEPEEEDATLFRHLAAVLRHCLIIASENEDDTDELKGHTVNLLSALPVSCLDVLVSVPLTPDSHQYDGVNMDCVHSLLMYMERRLEQGSKVKERLTPILNLLTECCRAHRETRHYLREQILPPLKDASLRPEQGTTMKSRLVRLMTHIDTELKHCAADLLFVLCKENVGRFVKYTGYGNAAGLLATRGLLGGQKSKDTSSTTKYSSDSDSDTEEYRQVKSHVNPVTGRVEEEHPDPMAGMTEEEKEEEACRLMSLFNKLSKDNVIQPMGLNAEGQLTPLSGLTDHSVEEDRPSDDDLEDVE
ncbi:synembryn-A [Chanos chanos]|uniref:Synembryn n=1 Tax=Chanos chanos TaxID=29144 RepID=A0A6J2VH71_CHACN|nr:synembryn-A-like [Chanos chanos]